MKRVAILPILFALVLGLAGCKSKTGSAKPAEVPKNKVKDAHSDGPHGGTSFDIGKHEYMAEVLVKDGKVFIYFHDHDEKDKPVLASEKELKITDISHDGKKLADITLPAKPLDGEKDGSSRFLAEGDAVKHITEAHALNGAKFKATIKGKEYDVEIHAAEHEDHDD